ncbi:MAG: (d)CMP kinase [Patescibacteria group bacterium]
MIISISGKPGSGKSTIAKRLAQDLGYKRYYMGDIFRAASKKKNLTLVEYLKLGEKDHSIDKEVDKQLSEIGKREDNLVIEGRTAYHFIPQSLKIFLDVDENIGAKRVFEDFKINSMRNEARQVTNVEDVLQINRERMKSDEKRYREIYGIDVFNPDNFDFFLDTTSFSKEEEYQKIFKYIKNRLG